MCSVIASVIENVTVSKRASNPKSAWVLLLAILAGFLRPCPARAADETGSAPAPTIGCFSGEYCDGNGYLAYCDAASAVDKSGKSYTDYMIKLINFGGRSGLSDPVTIDLGALDGTFHGMKCETDNVTVVSWSSAYDIDIHNRQAPRLKVSSLSGPGAIPGGYGPKRLWRFDPRIFPCGTEQKPCQELRPLISDDPKQKYLLEITSKSKAHCVSLMTARILQKNAASQIQKVLAVRSSEHHGECGE